MVKKEKFNADPKSCLLEVLHLFASGTFAEQVVLLEEEREVVNEVVRNGGDPLQLGVHFDLVGQRLSAQSFLVAGALLTTHSNLKNEKLSSNATWCSERKPTSH